MEYVRNDRGMIIGNIQNVGNLIYYNHIKFGQVGIYNTIQRQYTRTNLKLGLAFPMSQEDYGRSDILTADRIL